MLEKFKLNEALPGGMQLEEIGPILQKTGMASQQVSNLMRALAEACDQGLSITHLHQDMAIVNRYSLQQDSMLLLKTMLDAIIPEEESVKIDKCIRASLAQLDLDFRHDESNDCEEKDEEGRFEEQLFSSRSDSKEPKRKMTHDEEFQIVTKNEEDFEDHVNMDTLNFATDVQLDNEATTELPTIQSSNSRSTSSEWSYPLQPALDMSTTMSRPSVFFHSPSKNIPHTNFLRVRPPSHTKFSARRHTTTDLPSPQSPNTASISHTMQTHSSSVSPNLIAKDLDLLADEKTIQFTYDIARPRLPSQEAPRETHSIESNTTQRQQAIYDRRKTYTESPRHHTARHIVNGQWKIGKCIGHGSFGAVYTCMDETTGKLMAVKTIPIPMSCEISPGGRSSDHSSQSELAKLFKEIEYMRSFDHPNIVRYLGATVDARNFQLHIFQEWIPGGSIASLSEQYGPFAEAVVRRYTCHILRGLVYLHANQIIHRDIKCGNVLVDDHGVAKLADFGASHRLGNDGTLTNDMESQTMRGTPYFMAPEVLQQDKFGRRSDVWSVGGVVLQMATRDPPWKILNFGNPLALFYHMATTEESPPLDSYDLSSALKSFISRCFTRNPNLRPHAKELLHDHFLCGEDGAIGTISNSSTHDALDDTMTRIERVATRPGRGQPLSDSELNIMLSSNSNGGRNFVRRLEKPPQFDRSPPSY